MRNVFSVCTTRAQATTGLASHQWMPLSSYDWGYSWTICLVGRCYHYILVFSQIMTHGSANDSDYSVYSDSSLTENAVTVATLSSSPPSTATSHGLNRATLSNTLSDTNLKNSGKSKRNPNKRSTSRKKSAAEPRKCSSMPACQCATQTARQQVRSEIHCRFLVQICMLRKR